MLLLLTICYDFTESQSITRGCALDGYFFSLQPLRVLYTAPLCEIASDQVVIETIPSYFKTAPGQCEL